MTDLARRLARLERAAKGKGGCRECEGRGPMPRVLVWHEGTEPRPEHPTCPSCGRGPGAVRLVVLGDEPTRAA